LPIRENREIAPFVNGKSGDAHDQYMGSESLFLRIYGERLLAAYPARPDGKTLLPFLRVFIVAQKK